MSEFIQVRTMAVDSAAALASGVAQMRRTFTELEASPESVEVVHYPAVKAVDCLRGHLGVAANDPGIEELRNWLAVRPDGYLIVAWGDTGSPPHGTTCVGCGEH